MKYLPGIATVANRIQWRTDIGCRLNQKAIGVQVFVIGIGEDKYNVLHAELFRDTPSC